MISAEEAKKITRESNAYFEKMMKDIEKEIKAKAKQGYRMAQYNFAFDHDPKVCERLIDELIVLGYIVKGDKRDSIIAIEW